MSIGEYITGTAPLTSSLATTHDLSSSTLPEPEPCMTASRYLWCLPLVLLLAGCIDSSTPGPTAPRNVPAGAVTFQGPSTADQPEVLVQPRFAVDIALLSPIRLRTPIAVQYTVRGLIGGTTAKLALSLPEVEYAKANDWQPGGRKDSRAVIEAADRLVTAVPAGVTVTRTVQVEFREPGYYRLHATADAPAEPATHDQIGRVANFAHREMAIWVDENGGRTTTDFDFGILPDSVERSPGVRRLRARTRSAASARQKARPSGLALLPTPGTYRGRLRYMHAQTGQNLPIPGANIFYKIIDPITEQVISMHSGVTGPEGEWVIYCSDDLRFELTIHLGGKVDWPFDVYQRNYYWQCTQGVDDGDVLVGSNPAHAWLTFQQVLANSSLVFSGWERQSKVRIDLMSDEAGAHYHRSFIPPDKIRLSTLDNGAVIYGDWGAFTIAHEYGHAMHDAEFGGYPSSVGCPNPHGPHLQEGLTCAYVEGFASFYSVATMGAATGVELSRTESNSWFPNSGGNGRFNEGTVASFLYDLLDPPNEPHDDVQFPGQYIAQIVKSCDVRLHPPGPWFHGQDIGWNVWCLERGFDPFFMPEMPYVHSYRESATEPAGWSRDKVRAIWLWNFFQQSYSVPPPGAPPPPSITVNLAGYDSVRPSSLCYWQAAASGGSPSSYIYLWAINGEVVPEATGDMLPYFTPTTSGAVFTVEVTVSDGLVIPGSQSMQVTVSSQADECYQY